MELQAQAHQLLQLGRRRQRRLQRPCAPSAQQSWPLEQGPAHRLEVHDAHTGAGGCAQAADASSKWCAPPTARLSLPRLSRPVSLAAWGLRARWWLSRSQIPSLPSGCPQVLLLTVRRPALCCKGSSSSSRSSTGGAPGGPRLCLWVSSQAAATASKASRASRATRELATMMVTGALWSGTHLIVLSPSPTAGTAWMRRPGRQTQCW